MFNERVGNAVFEDEDEHSTENGRWEKYGDRRDACPTGAIALRLVRG